MCFRPPSDLALAAMVVSTVAMMIVTASRARARRRPGCHFSGEVDTYAAKWAAEDATKRVSGVRTVAQDLKVKLVSEHKHSDSEIAGATQNALKWDVFVPNAVTAKVQQGAVTLEGGSSDPRCESHRE